MDTCLPFGLRSDPFLFNEVATAIHWILEANYGFTNLVHYLRAVASEIEVVRLG